MITAIHITIERIWNNNSLKRHKFYIFRKSHKTLSNTRLNSGKINSTVSDDHLIFIMGIHLPRKLASTLKHPLWQPLLPSVFKFHSIDFLTLKWALSIHFGSHLSPFPSSPQPLSAPVFQRPQTVPLHCTRRLWNSLFEPSAPLISWCPLFRGHWQSPCTALMARQMPAITAVQGDCERVYFSPQSLSSAPLSPEVHFSEAADSQMPAIRAVQGDCERVYFSPQPL